MERTILLKYVKIYLDLNNFVELSKLFWKLKLEYLYLAKFLDIRKERFC